MLTHLISTLALVFDYFKLAKPTNPIWSKNSWVSIYLEKEYNTFVEIKGMKWVDLWIVGVGDGIGALHEGCW